MNTMQNNRTLLLVLLACFVIFALPSTSPGQSEERNPQDVERPMDADVEFQLHILVASNAVDGGKLPAIFESVVKDLRPSLPFTNYRLGASYLGRVTNGRPINIRGVGRSLLVSPGSESWELPPFYEMSAARLNLKADATGRATVQVVGFRFGLRIALQSAPAQGKEGGGSTPQISYEPCGITTDLTMREGEAVVVGTLDAGRPGETLVLVLVARRASTR